MQDAEKFPENNILKYSIYNNTYFLSLFIFEGKISTLRKEGNN